jgi:MSHA pilin protein MshD
MCVNWQNWRRFGVTQVKYQLGVTQAKHQLGVTLVELVVFMVIVSVALVGVLKVLEITNKGSADPLVRKQALSIAESLLLEVEQQPFTLCDPDDANAATAITTADCTGGTAASQDKGGAALSNPTPNTESRYSATNPLDNVADYGGFTMPDANCAGICSPGDNTPLLGLGAYTASVTITRVGASGPFAAFPLSAVLQIAVRVTGPANTDVTLTGYRVRYAPNI